MFERLLGSHLLDEIAIADRGAGSAKVAPSERAGANAGRARAELPRTRSAIGHDRFSWPRCSCCCGKWSRSRRQWYRSIELRGRRTPSERGRFQDLGRAGAANGGARRRLSLSLLGFSWLDARSRPRVLVLVDRSQSVPRAASDAAVADVMRAAKAAGSGDLQLLEFAGRPAAPSANAADSVADLEPSATNIEAALDAALAAHARSAVRQRRHHLGRPRERGRPERALRAAREARLPVQWIAVGRPPPETRISEVLAPDRAIGRPADPDHRAVGGAIGPTAARQGNRARQRAARRRRRVARRMAAAGRRSSSTPAATAPFSWTWRWRTRFRDKRSMRCRTPPSSTWSHGRRSCTCRVRPGPSRAACAKAAGR